MDVQKEYGHTGYNHTTMEHWICSNLCGSEMAMLLGIGRMTWGYNRKEFKSTVRDLCDLCNIPIKTGERIWSKLLKRNMVWKSGKLIGLVKDPEDWQPLKNEEFYPSIMRDSGRVSPFIYKKKYKERKADPSSKAKSLKKFQLKRKGPIPLNIELTDDMKNYYKKLDGEPFSDYLEKVFEDFKRYYLDRSEDKKRWHKDWHLTFYTWLRNDKKFHPDKYNIEVVNLW